MFATLNHTTRILDCDKTFAKTFKYNQNVNCPKYHYFMDCMKTKDYNELLQMNPGDTIEREYRFCGKRIPRGKKFNVKIKCVDTGEYDFKKNKNKVNYKMELELLGK